MPESLRIVLMMSPSGQILWARWLHGTSLPPAEEIHTAGRETLTVNPSNKAFSLPVLPTTNADHQMSCDIASSIQSFQIRLVTPLSAPTAQLNCDQDLL